MPPKTEAEKEKEARKQERLRALEAWGFAYLSRDAFQPVPR